MSDTLVQQAAILLIETDTSDYICEAVVEKLKKDIYRMAGETYLEAIDATPLGLINDECANNALNRWRNHVERVISQIAVHHEGKSVRIDVNGDVADAYNDLLCQYAGR